jgi:hypothetical protein
VQVTALACTLPRDSGKPLSRWSVTELACAVIQRGIVRRISPGTIYKWVAAAVSKAARLPLIARLVSR